MPLVYQSPIVESIPEESNSAVRTAEEAVVSKGRFNRFEEDRLPRLADSEFEDQNLRERPTEQTTRPEAATVEPQEMPSESKSSLHLRGDQAEGEQSDATERAPSPTPTACTSKSENSSGSCDSGLTVRNSLGAERQRGIDSELRVEQSRPVRDSRRSSPHQKLSHPDVLSFLEPGSPPSVTPEAIQRSIEVSRRRHSGGSSRLSPGARSSTSTASSSHHSDVFSAGDNETDQSSSPEQSINGDPIHQHRSHSRHNSRSSISSAGGRRGSTGSDIRRSVYRPKSYGTPEMPRGTANLPHIPPDQLQPRIPQNVGVKHLPRAEKLPLSGYELIASKLSPGPTGRAALQPMYRRFEAMNHRVLLNLQDELCELEEQLHHFDTLDTQTRKSLNGIIPASRRKEYLVPGELQWQKTDILGKIGYKLGQYNHVLSTFTETQNLPAPSMADVSEYRSYLATHNPVVEIETRFLESADDLVSVSRHSKSHLEDDAMSDGAPTPLPYNNSSNDAESIAGAPSFIESERDGLLTKLPCSAASTTASTLGQMNTSPQQVAVALAVSVLLPILTFSVIPSFIGRMIVVFLVALGVLSPLIQGAWGGGMSVDTQSALSCASIYGGAMAIVAAIIP